MNHPHNCTLQSGDAYSSCSMGESPITVKFQFGTTCYGRPGIFSLFHESKTCPLSSVLGLMAPWLRISCTIINIILNSIFKLWPSHQPCLSPMAQENITRTSSMLSKWSVMKRQLKCCHINLSRNTIVSGTERIGSFWRASYLFLLREYCLLHGTFWRTSQCCCCLLYMVL